MKFIFALLVLLVPAKADDATALLRRALPELRAAAMTVTARMDLTNPEVIQVELNPTQSAALQRRAQLVADVENYLRAAAEKPKLRAQPTLRK